MRTFKERTKPMRLVGALLLAGALSLSAPAFAIDTGGGGSSSSSGSGGSSSSSSAATVAVPSLAAARADIAKGAWAKAIAKLKLIVADQPRNADALNLMGFSLRQSGDMTRALQFYNKALKINPKHTGALEYMGELYVMTGKVDKAKENLAKIKGICGTSCEEYKDLAKAIGA